MRETATEDGLHGSDTADIVLFSLHVSDISRSRHLHRFTWSRWCDFQTVCGVLPGPCSISIFFSSDFKFRLMNPSMLSAVLLISLCVFSNIGLFLGEPLNNWGRLRLL